MTCAITADVGEYMKRFNDRIAQCRVPFTGSMDLTKRCNLGCVHCYVAAGSPGAQAESEMDTARIISVIDEIAEAGCLLLLMTGGEPLLRHDFAGIYEHARTKGILVTVFTNGTLITEPVAELFRALPPQAVEISLYGASAETYEKITGVSGSYERCLEGVRLLTKRKINVKLKTILMTLNSHEFFAMERMAEDLGIRFRFDAAIFPRLDGDKTPLDFRVSPEEAVGKELHSRERLYDWIEFDRKYGDRKASGALYTCAAGITSFHIDALGYLQPCLMAPHVRYDLASGSFMTGWREAMPAIRQRTANTGYACNSCENRNLCGYCPAFFKMENNDEELRSEYLCALGNNRARVIREIKA